MHDLTTRLVEARVNIKVIQELCGHSSSDVTLDIYTIVTKELKQREFGNFEEKMKQQKTEWEKELVIKQKMRGSDLPHLFMKRSYSYNTAVQRFNYGTAHC